MSGSIKNLPGFREFFPQECARRNYVFEAWRRVSQRFGFVEWEGPTLEPTELYRRKSGDEIVQQLFCFEDKSGREVTLRPEVTPSVARMAAARQRDFKKPMKWFEIGTCFRYETPQKGRLREFYQWNADLMGETSLEAEAELIALVLGLLKELGFTAAEVGVRLSDRRLWSLFAEKNQLPAEKMTEFLAVIDKWERDTPEKLEARLQPLGLTRAMVSDFMESTRHDAGPLQPLIDSLRARELGDFIMVDPTIVRGLAYYTGVVFECFSLGEGMRAVAGGGRYDQLISVISEGAVDLAAVGMGMGDVVLSDLIEVTPAAKAKRDAWLAQNAALDAYVVIAEESTRPAALAWTQSAREAGLRIDLALTPTKIGKQFQAAEALHAETAVVFGAEYPQLKLKTLATREEIALDAAEMIGTLKNRTP